MKFNTNLFRSIFSKAALAAVALGGFLFLAGAPKASAEPWRDCRRPVVYSRFYREPVFVRPVFVPHRYVVVRPAHVYYGWR